MEPRLHGGGPRPSQGCERTRQPAASSQPRSTSMFAAHQPMPITREGYERLQATLEDLTTRGRDELAAWLRDAREAGGEPGENADVTAALSEREALERR